MNHLSRENLLVLSHGSLHLGSLHFAISEGHVWARVKGYYDIMINKHHCEDVYDLIDLGVGRSHLKGLAPK